MNNKLILILSLTVCLLIPGASLFAQDYSFIWTLSKTDGSRTGVVASNASNVEEAMGKIEAGKYIAPNGRVFKKGSTQKAAKIVIEAQSVMAPLKNLVAHSAKEMVRNSPECELSDWIIDFLMETTEQLTGKKVDIGITNFGGIRVDLPKGDVLEDDLKSMFPFKNSLVYVAIKGSRVKEIFEQMAATKIQVIGGARIVVKDHNLVSLTIDGKPVEDDKVYGLATIDFLLNGGDRLFLSKDAVEIIDTKTYIIDAILPYVKSLEAKGEMIDYNTDGRVTILPSENDNRRRD